MCGVCEHKEYADRAFPVKALLSVLLSILSVFTSKGANIMFFFGQGVSSHQNWSLHLRLCIAHHNKLRGLRDP